MMRLARFLLLSLLLSAIALQAQPYPAKPLRLIVGFPVGARLVAQHVSERFGQAVVVDNRLGATGTIAAEMVARSAPDGYTLFMATQPTNAVAPHRYAKVGYDPVRDFAAVVRVAHNPLLVAVHPSLPVKSVSELISLAKARPGQINFASGGIGSS